MRLAATNTLRFLAWSHIAYTETGQIPRDLNANAHVCDRRFLSETALSIVVAGSWAEVGLGPQREQYWSLRPPVEQTCFQAVEHQEVYWHLQHIGHVVVSTAECLWLADRDQRLALSSIEGKSKGRRCQTAGYEAPPTVE